VGKILLGGRGGAKEQPNSKRRPPTSQKGSTVKHGSRSKIERTRHHKKKIAISKIVGEVSRREGSREMHKQRTTAKLRGLNQRLPQEKISAAKEGTHEGDLI